MHDPVPHGPSLAFLVAAWVVFLFLGVVYVVSALSLGHWPAPLPLEVLLVLWLAITGLLVRRLWPGSRIARVLPERIRGVRYDAPQRRPGLTILLVFAVAIVLVAASLRFHWF